MKRNKVEPSTMNTTSRPPSEPTTPTQSPRSSNASQKNTGEPHLPMMSFFLPDSVLDMVAAMIDRLSSEQRLILKVASVMGTFEMRILEGVFPPIQKQRTNIRVELDALERLGYLTSTTTTTVEAQYEFFFLNFSRKNKTDGI